MIDFRTLSDTSTSKIPTLSCPCSPKKVPLSGEASPCQYREYPRPSPPGEFAIFPAIRKNKFPQIKIYSRALKYSLDITSYTKKTVLRNRVCSITTCLFHSETKRYTMKLWCIRLKIHVCISIARTQ